MGIKGFDKVKEITKRRIKINMILNPKIKELTKSCNGLCFGLVFKKAITF